MSCSTALCVGADIAGRRSQCQVVSCFTHACNLRLLPAASDATPGPLLTLLCGMAERGMRLINLSPTDWPALTMAWRPGQHIRLNESGLTWPNGCIDFQRADIWRSQAVPAFDSRQSGQALQRLQTKLTIAEQAQSANPLRQAAFERFTALLAQLAGEPEQLDPAVAALLGAGPGLTPSGDDLLCGLLAGLQTSDPHGVYLRLTASIEQQLTRTGDISQEYLTQSCRGWLSENMERLIDTLCHDKPLDDAFNRLAARGQTSGLDLMHVLAGAWRLAATQQTATTGH